MRSSLERASLIAASLTLAATIAPAAGYSQGARPFEGVVTFKAEGSRTMDYSIRQGQIRVDATHEFGRAVMIMHPAARKMYMVMPAQQMYMEMEIPDEAQPESDENIAPPVKTGKTEVVAGHECEYYRVTHEEGATEVCLASDMGGFRGFATPMSRQKAPAWQRELGDKYFPLKVVAEYEGEKRVVLEATRVESKKLPASLFAPPASYRKMDAKMKSPGPGPR